MALPSFAETWVSLRPARNRARPIAMGRAQERAVLAGSQTKWQKRWWRPVKPIGSNVLARSIFENRRMLGESIMRLAFIMVVAALLATNFTKTAQAAPTDPSPEGWRQPQKVLVYLDCAATDEQAVTETLQGAISSCVDRYAVTLFIDLQAVVLATREPKGLSKRQATIVDGLFDKLQSANVLIIVCPHCAGQANVAAKQLRHGVRFTTKQEFEELAKNADRVLRFKPTVNRRPDAGCVPTEDADQ